MTPADYSRERAARGSRVEIAEILGIHPKTLAKRERGAPDAPITREAWLALRSIRKPKAKGADPPPAGPPPNP